jgi:long-chain acyl-CoA synthetase
MRGYWNMPEETAEVLRDGWLHTGDVARMDEDGYFYIVDRKKDMISTSGYNVYPREIEEVLYEHKEIAEAVAIGVEDEYRGETVKAFVVRKPDSEVTEVEMLAFCKEHLDPQSGRVPRRAAQEHRRQALEARARRRGEGEDRSFVVGHKLREEM